MDLRQSPIRLLVVDDNPAVRVCFAEFFDAHDDFDVVGQAANGEEAVALCVTLDPDGVLMDVRMPVLDGIQATRLIKQHEPEPVVVLVTAYEQEELLVAGREAGADAFLFKGMQGAQLVETVRAAVRSELKEQLCV